MKPFSVYLQDSHKIYEFKIKIAGDLDRSFNKDIARALDVFRVVSCSAGKRLPIAEMHMDFPEHKNTNVTIFDIVTSYPATSMQVRNEIASKLKIAEDRIKVRNLKEQDEIEINHEHAEPTEEALLGKDYEESNHQDMVGDKWVMTFLKELAKTKHEGEQYTGVNDHILAKGAPQHSGETPAKQVESKINIKNLFTKQVKVPDPTKGAR